MESTKTSITAPEPPQPSFRDRLIYSRWYLEARTAVKQYAAHHNELVRRLNELLSREGGSK